MMNFLKKYKGVLIVSVIYGLTFLFNKNLGLKATDISLFSFKEMLLVIPPIFILMGLLDVWVPKEIMIKYMGEGSGIKGIIFAFLIGSAAAGPLYGAFPVAAIFMKKGVKFSNILIFIGAWSTTKIPMLLFEAASLGMAFTITRLLVDIPGIIVIAYIISKMLSPQEKQKIYEINSKE